MINLKTAKTFGLGISANTARPRRRGDRVRRREFIALAGGAAAAWPFAVRAQQPQMLSLGLLTGTNLEDWASKAIREGLDETGYEEGRNLTIIPRSAEFGKFIGSEIAKLGPRSSNRPALRRSENLIIPGLADRPPGPSRMAGPMPGSGVIRHLATMERRPRCVWSPYALNVRFAPNTTELLRRRKGPCMDGARGARGI